MVHMAPTPDSPPAMPSSSAIPPSDSSLSSSSSASASTSFHPPTKRILTPEQLVAFQQSPTHGEIVGFIEELNDAVRGVKLRDGEEEVKDVEVGGLFM